MIKDQSQRPPSGVGKNFRVRAICLEAKDATIGSSRIDSILAVDGDVFRRETIER